MIFPLCERAFPQSLRIGPWEEKLVLCQFYSQRKNQVYLTHIVAASGTISFQDKPFMVVSLRLREESRAIEISSEKD